MTARLLVWEADDPPVGIADPLPRKQTLERLILAAVAKSDPGVAGSIAGWLASRPGKPAKDEHKSAMWSHMAGWHAGDGCTRYFGSIWKQYRSELLEQLRRISADGIPAFLAGK